MNTADKLATNITEGGLIVGEKLEQLSRGKPHIPATLNVILSEHLEQINDELWMDKMTERLECLHTAIESREGNQNKVGDYKYIPTPGEKDGVRIQHPSELSNKRSQLGPISDAPDYRSRELAFKLPLKKGGAGTDTHMLLILTFDPNLVSWSRAKKGYAAEIRSYWEGAARNAGWELKASTPTYYALTGLHEWMRALKEELQPEKFKRSQDWKRWPVTQNERESGKKYGVDLYYSSSLVCYGF